MTRWKPDPWPGRLGPDQPDGSTPKDQAKNPITRNRCFFGYILQIKGHKALAVRHNKHIRFHYKLCLHKHALLGTPHYSYSLLRLRDGLTAAEHSPSTH